MVDLAVLTSQFILWSQSVAETWGYLGIFIISFIGSASIIFPVPFFIVVFASGGIMNPILVGLVAGLGSALGELIGYLVGLGGHKVIKKRNKKWLLKAKKWSRKRGIFPIIILFAATPLPDDIVGILAGIIRYDIRKFFLASVIGNVIMMLALALGGFYGMAWVMSIFGGL